MSKILQYIFFFSLITSRCLLFIVSLMDTLQLYEVLSQPRTVSRDSGYTTPSPMVGNVSAKDNQKVCYNFLFSYVWGCCNKKVQVLGEGAIFIYHATKQ
jgi:hypothetical protein